MSTSIEGRRSWGPLVRDDDGHREYKLLCLVRATSYSDGPERVMNTAGLPMVGSIWNFGNDSDPWAICHPNMRVTIHKKKEGDPNIFWQVEQTFSTKPLNRCQDTNIEDPLLEPQKVSGTFAKFTEEAGYGYTDLDAAAAGGERTKILSTSSHEPLRQATVSNGLPTVQIGQNVATLGLSTFSNMMDTVNDDELWGLAKRKIKLSNVTWERKIWATCDYYYTRTFDFEIDFKTFDRKEPDFGTKCIQGDWDAASPPAWVIKAGANKDNPQHFQRFKDVNGEVARTFLNGSGYPVASQADAAEIDIIYYEESNFLLLGIPTVIGL